MRSGQRAKLKKRDSEKQRGVKSLQGAGRGCLCQARRQAVWKTYIREQWGRSSSSLYVKEIILVVIRGHYSGNSSVGFLLKVSLVMEEPILCQKSDIASHKLSILLDYCEEVEYIECTRTLRSKRYPLSSRIHSTHRL